MQEISAHTTTEKEAKRREIDAVVDALARSPRLANLLRYVGDKYIQGETDQLTEYNIATEVFGRSKTSFDAAEDAIARVETHRLRKRLKEFYDGSGRDHLVQVSIPPGTYIPAFTSLATEPPQSLPVDEPVAEPASVEPAGSSLSIARAPKRRFFRLVAPLAAALICVAAIAYYAFSHSHFGPVAPRNAPASADASLNPALPFAAVPLRLLAGYTGAPQTDSAGAAWGADRYVTGGGVWRRPDAPIARTSDPLLFQQWRSGDFSYDIPLRPGTYELHLYFVTSDNSTDALSTFTVRINGSEVLSGFDINSDALGQNIADERIFRDISPASDGLLHIAFNSERGAPQLNALEILPGIPHKQLPIRILAQRTSFTDHNGQFWHPDNYYMNGRLSDQGQQTTGASDSNLFTTERYGHFTYALPVDPRDRYTLVLHFAEFYFGPQTAGGGGAGNRVFRVLCNGQTLLDNFDIYNEAGTLHVLTKAFYHLKPSAQGKLNVIFEPVFNNATVSGIEVLDESQ